MSNIYSIYKSEGFMDLSIHHVGGLSIWIQFSSPLSCSKFWESDSLKSIYSVIKAPSSLFRVDERMIWLEISGLPLCAWGLNSYKKITSLFVEVNGELFDVNVLEIGTWNANITDTASDVSSQMVANHLDKDDTSVEDKENDDLDDIDGILKDLDNDAKNEKNVFVSPKEVVPDQPIKQVEEDILKQPEEECIKVSESSELSRPPGFKNTKRPSQTIAKAPPILLDTTRRTSKNRLAKFMNQHNGKFILFGDFNTVLHEYERSGSLFSRIKAEHFNAFIDSTCLIDLPIRGRHFTWMNKVGTKLSKLDRFFISEGVMEDIPDIKVTAIERLWYDHSPILLHSKKANFSPSLFKLYNSWLSIDGFDDIVKSTWDSMETGNGSNKISSHVKLRNLKNAIKKWQVDVRKIDISQKSANLSEIHDIEKKIDDGSASISDHEKRIKLLQDIDKLENLEALDLIQKSRIKWDIEGEENSKFFHRIINSKRRTQAIADFLESHISLDEVKNVIWECSSNKAPGLDGANSSFLTLIPNINNPLSVKDFRPISLIGTHYKIISKLISNRLSKVIDKWYKKRKKKMLIFKVDFKKVFDSVSWKYLDFILDSLGFGSKWRSWIRACLHSSRASILINVMEGLHYAMSNAVNSELIHGIKLGSSGIVLSHVFYADDMIITTDWNPYDIDN
uniref:Reverse transcriptase domain-containing protein n=1 Tax=Tanacetum cinerariifolium TaxID=118510 RepID=A0A699J6D3_TANCI|nr:hypothetical protein [Tanacetum cinerariifolium]